MYARIENDQVAEYPLSELDVRGRFPNTSLPTDLANNLPDGYVRVAPSSQPSDPLKTVTEGTPAFEDGMWVQGWVQADKYTAEELAQMQADELESKWNDFRSGRNKRLEQSDWVVLRHRDEKDLGLATTISDAEYLTWLTYRKQLRDLPGGVTDPNVVVWPTPPGELGVS